jgi:hypothetical protein
LYKLQLPEGMGAIHPVFHTSLLHPDPNDLLPGQYIQPQGLVQVANNKRDKQYGTYNKWEVKNIVDS